MRWLAILVLGVLVGCGEANGGTESDSGTTPDAGGSDAAIVGDAGDAGSTDGSIERDADLNDADLNDADLNDASPCDGVCTSSDTMCPTDCALCLPGTTSDCYGGPAGTEDVGVCVGGTATCSGDGASYGPCAGAVVPGIEDCESVEDEDCDGDAPACGAIRFADVPSGSGSVSIRDLAARDGRTVIVGEMSGMVDFGGGLLTASGVDAFVAVYDDHAFTWAHVFGDSAVQSAISVALDDAGGVYVAGAFAGTMDPGLGPLVSAGGDDAFLAAFAADGTARFARRFGDVTNQRANGVAVSGTQVVIAGEMLGMVDFGGGARASMGGRDVFVALFDTSGGHIASVRFGDALAQVANGVAISPSGSVYVVGTFSGAMPHPTGLLVSAGSSDVFLLALTPGLALRWAVRFGAVAEDVGLDVAASSTRVAIGGSFQQTVSFGGAPLTSGGGSDAFVASYDEAGAHLASLGLGDPSLQATRAVAIADDGTVAFGGSFAGTISPTTGALVAMGTTNAFAIELAGSTARYGVRMGSDTARTNGIALDGSELVVGGDFTGTIDLGAGPITASAGGSGFVASLIR